ncbi:MAG: PilZ domain-containing protein [Acidobacteriota bacterium]
MIRGERRKHFRFGCSCFGEARFENSSVEKISIKNISYEGLKVLIGRRELSVGDEIEVRVDIPGKRVYPLVTGKIRWINSVKEGTELGIKLHNMAQSIKRELIDYGFSVWRDRLQYKH